ncbi:MAG: hypothetical protein AAGD11_13870 [Planctomycetota bacterium]
MANRIFVSAVVVLWLSSMTWLVTDRILPSFFGGGQPPIAQAYEDGEAVAWQVIWQGRRVGQAASVRLSGVGGSTDLFNRVVLEEFPVMELAPSWIRATVGNLGSMTFDVLTRVEFDPLGKFSSFNSRISLNDMPSILKMTGRIEDSYLNLRVRSNDLSHTTRIFLPNSEALSETLFPDAKLPYMHIGRNWQEKVYSPFSSPADPVELVQVEVVAKETLQHQGEVRPVMRVEYRSITSSGIPLNARVQGISWVDPITGDVLRRDVFLGNSKLRFERLSKEAAMQSGLDLFEDQLMLNGHDEAEDNSRTNGASRPEVERESETRG